MAAYTISQLEEILGSYVKHNALTFYEMMKQLLPRMYSMGMWPDLYYEISLSGENGYVNLPQGTAGVLACTVNNQPRLARSMWHDVRISGRSTFLSSYYGIVDAGFYPVLFDMVDVQGTDTPVTTAALHAYIAGTQTPITAETAGGGLTVSVLDSASVTSNMVCSDTGSLILTPTGAGIVSIKSIMYEGIAAPFDLVDPAFPAKVIATVPTGSGVLRYHRFRTPEKSPTCTVHLLLKRDAPTHIAEDTVVHLGNIGAIKNAILAIIDEDSGDRARAKDSWLEVQKILDAELLAVLGSAKPTLRVDFGPCSPIRNLM